MSRVLGRIAEDLQSNERTLRRYVNDGLLRGRRLSHRYVELPATEERYLRDNWTLLSRLRRALRTERSVRMAILFGSTATGEANTDSDVDLLVELRETDPLAPGRLALRVRSVLGRSVQITTLSQARAQPSLLADALVEGRVLVDRDGSWASVREDSREVVNAAAAAEARAADLAERVVADARARL